MSDSCYLCYHCAGWGGTVRSVTNRRSTLLAATMLPALVLSGCTIGDAGQQRNAAAPSSLSPAGPALVNNAAPLAAGALTGKKIFVDPGHNGANDASINKQVPTGRGGTKPCQTTGTTSVNGVPEHTFNYAVAYKLYQALTAAGAQVMLSRNDDTSVASCIDARAAAANSWGADAAVSIHADGSAPGNRGFHVNLSSPPLNPAQQTASPAYAAKMRDALVAGGFTPASYIGSGGLYPRSDLAGLNLATVPSVLVEAGNLRDATEAKMLESADGQQRLADAIAAGLAAYLGSPATR
ncbi:N-acetylmuramoyl-L-alanine amidase [Tsukamurella tyrosinosolvens]|uniref:N-acetylmuramoyl-L-alanine amidase n=2 Tax=Tsukamurella tyrosinosolvens TaxID=57704 RepID=A0A1H5C3V7_TSUTY|nr:Rv3717 family N-acetylmuramoyl-L-alanine amidase [Tsukamurella tyrosinosolvens]SED61326.1 N-acetylmuramoyl-L-alanine amidase [Tsukamurella tyrosinosolvens]